MAHRKIDQIFRMTTRPGVREAALRVAVVGRSSSSFHFGLHVSFQDSGLYVRDAVNSAASKKIINPLIGLAQE